MMDCVVDGADAMQPIGESLVTVIESVDPIFQIIENISEVSWCFFCLDLFVERR